MITRDEWDKLTPDEMWDKYYADYFGGFSLSDIKFKPDELNCFMKYESVAEIAKAIEPTNAAGEN